MAVLDTAIATTKMPASSAGKMKRVRGPEESYACARASRLSGKICPPSTMMVCPVT
jgi:hypothetical protein